MTKSIGHWDSLSTFATACGTCLRVRMLCVCDHRSIVWTNMCAALSQMNTDVNIHGARNLGHRWIDLPHVRATYNVNSTYRYACAGADRVREAPRSRSMCISAAAVACADELLQRECFWWNNCARLNNSDHNNNTSQYWWDRRFCERDGANDKHAIRIHTQYTSHCKIYIRLIWVLRAANLCQTAKTGSGNVPQHTHNKCMKLMCIITYIKPCKPCVVCVHCPTAPQSGVSQHMLTVYFNLLFECVHTTNRIVCPMCAHAQRSEATDKYVNGVRGALSLCRSYNGKSQS